jgi:hypothetical protein
MSDTDYTLAPAVVSADQPAPVLVPADTVLSPGQQLVLVPVDSSGNIVGQDNPPATTTTTTSPLPT